MIYSNQEILDLINDYNNGSLSEIEKDYIDLNEKREQFILDYNINKLANLNIYEYVSGIKKSGLSYNYRTFCYRLETELRGLGSINGATAFKFGIYYDTKTREFSFVKRLGDNYIDAFNMKKELIIDLIVAGNNNDYEKIDNIEISHMFKYKILATYFPDKYLCICTEDHIEQFVERLGYKLENKKTSIYSLIQLLKIKDNYPAMQEWSNHVYCKFLYEMIGYDNKQIELDKKSQVEKDKNYSKEFKYSSSITEKMWIEVLNDKDIFGISDIELLKQIYNFENHATTCHELALINGKHTSSYNKQIVELSKRVLNHFELEPIKDKKGKYIFSCTLFWGRNKSNGHFEWKIRPKLVKALEKTYSSLSKIQINEDLDDALSQDIKKIKIDHDKTYSYTDDIVTKPEPIILKGIKVYKRNRQVSINALGIAEFKCEINEEHKTFIRKSDGTRYVESHHLIPMSFQDDFDNSLDIEENIVSLCSSRHNEIHYGENSKSLIEQMFEQRKNLLSYKGLTITLEKLISYYNKSNS